MSPGIIAAPDHSVRHYITQNVPTAMRTDSVAAARECLASHSYDDASHLFVLHDGDRFAGIVEMARLMAAAPSVRLSDLVTSSSRSVVTPETDREDAASLAIGGGLSALAACEADGRFIGAVPASALMSILRDEHMEDLHLMAGILGSSAAAQAALTAPPHRRALYRLPWLLAGVAGSAVATVMMAQFEAALHATIAVAFFIPAVVYLADAIGTQSEAVAVRGLSLTRVNLLALLAGEVSTGMLIGALLGALVFPLVLFGFGSIPLATTVAVSVVAASSIATTVGFLLPWLFFKLGYDPALGSGPLGAVIQDLLSLLIYFAVAAALVF